MSPAPLLPCSLLSTTPPPPLLHFSLRRRCQRKRTRAVDPCRRRRRGLCSGRGGVQPRGRRSRSAAHLRLLAASLLPPWPIACFFSCPSMSLVAGGISRNRLVAGGISRNRLVAGGISRTRSPPWRSLPFCSSQPAPKRKLLIVGVAAVSGVLLLGAIFGCCCFWRKKRQAKTVPSSHGDVIPVRLRKRPAVSPAWNQWLEENKMGSELDFDLPFFDLEVILTATNDFTPDSKIRQGGFRSVYMGKLEDGQEVTVKWLSKKSVQGVGEFKNEVKLIAKLQLRNLMKLLGCSMDDDERMLVYEFMPSNSLDTFIFDEEKCK